MPKQKEESKSLVEFKKKAAEAWKGNYNDYLAEMIYEEGIPLAGMTILGGTPYINTTGIDSKVIKKIKGEGLKFSCTTKPVTVPVAPTSDSIFKYEATAIFFDINRFQKMFEDLIKAELPPEVFIQSLDRIKDVCTETHTRFGVGSSLSIGISRNKGKDNHTEYDVVEMTVETRASNRAKRSATGTGFTSITELPDGGLSLDDGGEAFNYSEVKEYLDDERLTKEDKDIILEGMQKNKVPKNMISWIEKRLKEIKENKKESKSKPSKAPEAPPQEPEKKYYIKDIKGSDKQRAEFRTLTNEPVFTEEEIEENIRMACTIDVERALEFLQIESERRNKLNKFYQSMAQGVPILEAKVLKYLNENIGKQQDVVKIIEKNLDDKGKFTLTKEKFYETLNKEFGL